jgi:hypothetical protein
MYTNSGNRLECIGMVLPLPTPSNLTPIHPNVVVVGGWVGGWVDAHQGKPQLNNAAEICSAWSKRAVYSPTNTTMYCGSRFHIRSDVCLY